MFVLPYLVLLLASKLPYKKKRLGFYKEKFTKKFEALNFTEDYKISNLVINNHRKNDFSLSKTKLGIENGDVFIYGLMKKNKFNSINSLIKEHTNHFMECPRIFKNGESFFFDNPLKLTLNYEFSRNVSPNPQSISIFDYYKISKGQNMIILKREIDPYEKLCNRVGCIVV
ncbi:hypothetical protein NGRA_0405 [Nosema granulosis]|uniref:Uncharacterized protein n=1 Tax=Nosema granulosis TaxID=83296 RepID=A0A9P6H1F8_9MICR|nr:hypothetical protein NGRA_0405 [Nosema granulosis]